MKRRCGLCLGMLLLAVSWSFGAQAQEGWTVRLRVRHGTAVLEPTLLNGEMWLFLPSFAAADRISLLSDGVETGWQETACGDGTFLWQTDNGGALHVMRSANLRALFLFSDDPHSRGRAWIDGAADHETHASGAVALINAEGRVDYTGNVSQIRGRGNFTWQLEKKAYQFKLEEKADLLQTGIAEEWNRTWILLADSFDGTMLHNRITMDLALEMGLSNTSRCEHVDLYYDGEYRGLYLLAEKVEAGEGRLGVEDYGERMERWNRAAGQHDLDALAAVQGENRYGNAFACVDGIVDAGTPDQAAYVLEMEHEINTLSARCWFRMSDGSILSCQSPANASESMMRYISERLEEARQTLRNGGVHPENGRTIAEDFNLHAFARHMLLAELSYNADAYCYSSTWFVLPSGSTRFEPGTVWDFDLAYRYCRSGENAHGAGLRARSGWMTEFYSCPAFVEVMQEVYAGELLPLVQNILLGNERGRCLMPLDDYAEEIDASRRMNDRLWDWVVYDLYHYGGSVREEYALLRQFLTQRSAWLERTLLSARADADRIDLWAYTSYQRMEQDMTVCICPWNHAEVEEAACRQLKQSTQTSHALWELSAVLRPCQGYAWISPVVVMNGTALGYEWQNDGSIRIRAVFEAPSCRPDDFGRREGEMEKEGCGFMLQVQDAAAFENTL